MGITRKIGWDVVYLHQFFTARSKMPFAWGTNDCCTFAADAILAMTGTDIAAPFRGKYTDLASALGAIKAVTKVGKVSSGVAHCATKAGLAELTQPAMARRGDLVLVEDNDTWVAGVVHLNGRNVAVVGKDGVVLKALNTIRRAWRVGA
jgi:hypothetical protein